MDRPTGGRITKTQHINKKLDKNAQKKFTKTHHNNVQKRKERII